MGENGKVTTSHVIWLELSLRKCIKSIVEGPSFSKSAISRRMQVTTSFTAESRIEIIVNLNIR